MVKFLLGVGAVVVLLAIMVPNYFAKLERNAVAELRTVHEAQREHQARSGEYAATLEALGLGRFAAGAPHTYRFTLTRTAAGYTATARPLPLYGYSRRTVQIDQTGKVRFWSAIEAEAALSQPATAHQIYGEAAQPMAAFVVIAADALEAGLP